MGRAIVRDPQVFLFDEPLSNLDAKLRVQMRTEIKELHQRLKTTTIYVTHDQIEAMTMADKIVVMQDGRVEQVGAPLDLYDRPANLFVAGFIGSPAMNLLKGKARVEDGEVLRRRRRSLPAAGRRAASGRGWAGRDSTASGPSISRSLARTASPAQIAVVEPTGSETMVFCACRRATTVGAVPRAPSCSSPATIRARAAAGPTASIFSTPRPASGI